MPASFFVGACEASHVFSRLHAMFVVAFFTLSLYAAHASSANDLGLDMRSVQNAGVLLRTGHGDIDVNAAKRFTGIVSAVGAPDDQGRIVSITFKPPPLATPPLPNSLIGWRLTVMSGKRFSSAFEVRSNTE